MNKCEKCGSLNNYDSSFCFKCGQRLKDPHSGNERENEDFHFDKALERLKKDLAEKKVIKVDDNLLSSELIEDPNSPSNKDFKPVDNKINDDKIKVVTLTEDMIEKSIKTRENRDDEKYKANTSQNEEAESTIINENKVEESKESFDENEKIELKSNKGSVKIKRMRFEKKLLNMDPDYDITIAPKISNKEIKKIEVEKLEDDKLWAEPSPSHQSSYDYIEDDEDNLEVDREENRRKTRFILSILLTLLLVFLLALGLYKFILNDARLVSTGDRYLASGKYKEAIEIYDKVLNKKPNPQVLKKKEMAVEKLKEMDLLSKSPEEYSLEEYKKIVDLSKKSETNIQKALEVKEKIEGLVEKKVKEAMAQSNYDKAKDILQPYIDITEDSLPLNTLNTAIEEHFSAMERKEKEEKEAELNKEILEKSKETTVLSNPEDIKKEEERRQKIEKETPIISPLLKSLNEERDKISQKNKEGGRDPDYNMMTTQLEWELGHKEAEVRINLNDFIEDYLKFREASLKNGDFSNLDRFIFNEMSFYDNQKDYLSKLKTDGKSLKLVDYMITNIINLEDDFLVSVSQVYEVKDSKGKTTKSSERQRYLIKRTPSYNGFLILYLDK